MLGCAQQEIEAHVRGVTREQHTTTAIDSVKSHTHSAKPAVFGVFSPNGSAVWRPHPPRLAAPPPPNGGNCIIRAATRRRYAASQLLMLQNPHHSKPEVRRIVYKSLAQHRLVRRNSSSTPQTTDFRPFFVRRANFFALTPTIRPSRANFFAHRTPPAATMQPMTPPQPLMQASMKPPSPLRAPEKQPLKPTTPLQPKNAPKTPISHPQRR